MCVSALGIFFTKSAIMVKPAGNDGRVGPGRSGAGRKTVAGRAGGLAADGDGGGSAADRNSDAQEVAIGWKLAGLGFQTASEVGAGALLGWLADRWLNTAPAGILIGSMAGISVGLWSLIRGALKLNRQLDAISSDRRARRAERGEAPTWRKWEEDAEENDDAFDNHQPADDER